MLEVLMKRMVQAQGITEQLKADNQMPWAGTMNNIRGAAEELVFRQIVATH